MDSRKGAFYAHVREKFLDLPVVPVASVVRGKNRYHCTPKRSKLERGYGVGCNLYHMSFVIVLWWFVVPTLARKTEDGSLPPCFR